MMKKYALQASKVLANHLYKSEILGFHLHRYVIADILLVVYFPLFTVVLAR